MCNIFDTDFLYSMDKILVQLPNINIIFLFLTNKEIKSYIETDYACKRLLRQRLCVLGDNNPDRVSVNIRYIPLMKRLSLYTFRGCMLCGAKKIRKVYEAFELRLCRKCLYSNTIERHYLLHSYNIDPYALEDLPYTQTEMYIKKNRVGYCTLNHYWKQSIELILGKTFQQIDDERTERIHQMILLRNEEMDQYRREWYRIFRKHVPDIIPYEELILSKRFTDFCEKRVKHYDDRTKARRLYTRLIKSYKT